MRTVSVEQLREVAGDVLSIAAQNGLRTGSRLPTERALAEGLRLSRTTIRNAMALLEEDGVVSREVGRGTFLRRDPQVTTATDVLSAPRSAVAASVSPADVMNARLILEPAAIIAAVENATIKDFEEIERCLLGCENAQGYEDHERWDLELHLAIIRASHNPLMEMMYLLIDEARRGATWGSLKRRSDSSERREHYRHQHRAIAEALRNRDGRAAREAMQRHLNAVGANLQKSAHS